MLRTLINPGSGAYCSWMSIYIDNVFPNIPGKQQHLLYEHLCQILNVTKANYVICYVMYYTTEKQPLAAAPKFSSHVQSTYFRQFWKPATDEVVKPDCDPFSPDISTCTSHFVFIQKYI